MVFIAFTLGAYADYVKDAKDPGELAAKTGEFGAAFAGNVAVTAALGPGGSFVSMSSDRPENAAQIESERAAWDLMAAYFPGTVGSFLGFQWLRGDPEVNGRLFNEVLAVVRTPNLTEAEVRQRVGDIAAARRENEMSDR
jgi:hypothetical protein